MYGVLFIKIVFIYSWLSLMFSFKIREDWERDVPIYFEWNSNYILLI